MRTSKDPWLLRWWMHGIPQFEEDQAAEEACEQAHEAANRNTLEHSDLGSPDFDAKAARAEAATDAWGKSIERWSVTQAAAHEVDPTRSWALWLSMSATVMVATGVSSIAKNQPDWLGALTILAAIAVAAFGFLASFRIGFVHHAWVLRRRKKK